MPDSQGHGTAGERMVQVCQAQHMGGRAYEDGEPRCEVLDVTDPTDPGQGGSPQTPREGVYLKRKEPWTRTCPEA